MTSSQAVVIDNDTGLVIDPTALSLLMPDAIEYEEWLTAGRYLAQVDGRIQWLIGDWWAFGDARPEWGVGKKVADDVGLNYQTCRDAGWVSGKFELSRRRDNLPWSVHKEVAALQPEQQDEILDWRGDKGELPTVAKAREMARAAKRGALPPVEPGKHTPQIYQCSIADLEIEPGTVDAIICDPPYPKDFLWTYSVLAERASVWLKPDGNLLALSGHIWLPEILQRVGEHLEYNWLLCYQNANGAFASVFDRRVTNVMWKPVLHYVKDKSKMRRSFSDLITSDAPDKDFHEWGQSESGFDALIERFTDPDDLVVDPFLGGGTTGVCAQRLGRRFIGCDVDDDAIAIAKKRMNMHE